MATSLKQLADSLGSAFGERLVSVETKFQEVTAIVTPENLIDVATQLKESDDFKFEQLVDLCGVDYSQFWCDRMANKRGF